MNACPMNSASPRIVRRGYIVTTERTISGSGIVLRWRTVSSPPLGSGSSRPVDSRTCCSMSSTMRSASSSRPCTNSQRGLSGTLRLTSRTASPITAPSTKDSRQPRSAGKIAVFSISTASSEPPMPPSQ